MATQRVLPTTERQQHDHLYAQEIMAEDDNGHLQLKAIVIRVRNKLWLDSYFQRGEISKDQLDAGRGMARLHERAGLTAKPATINLLRSGHHSAFTYGMAANEIQAAARLSYRKALYLMGSHETIVRRVACDNLPVIDVPAKRGAAYQAAKAYAMMDLCAGLDILADHFGMC